MDLFMLNGFDLFSGIGGISLALKDWVRTVVYCEIDPFCRGILASRMSTGDLSIAPIWDDITTFPEFEFEKLSGYIDIVFGGFPCQGISIARDGQGLADERSGLFYEIVRLCREIRPKFIFLENVPNITSRGGIEVVREITALGYDCRWCVISAESTGAPHKRERFFLLAYSQSERLQEKRQPMREDETKPLHGSSPESQVQNDWPESPPPFLRVGHGIPFRMERTKALGNSVCEKQAKEAFKLLMGLKEGKC